MLKHKRKRNLVVFLKSEVFNYFCQLNGERCWGVSEFRGCVVFYKKLDTEKHKNELFNVL